MKALRFLLTFITAFSIATCAFGQQWQMLNNRISTKWSEEVNASKPLNEYPRPQMVRSDWQNLNGLWEYKLTAKNQKAIPAIFDGKILVPFAIESSLSGVSKTVGKDSLLWYKTTFSIQSKDKKKNILLHFGAVDWQAEVFINGKKIGVHEGGYDSFSFDITPYLKAGRQELVVKVFDPTDQGYQPRGKQVRQSKGIWYTPVTGIWQTVWLEVVNPTYITSTKQTTDIDKGTIYINVKSNLVADKIKYLIYDEDRLIAEQEANETTTITIPNAKLWSPQHPFLYHVKIQLLQKGKVVDEVKTYFGMRKSSLGVDANGFQRMLLNDEFVFQFGTLDQGWWPDGLYTAPTDEALKSDILQTKAMGFNLIRKHVKVEPARWYYYCDSIGMLVWQDMPSGDLGNVWDSRPGIVGKATFKERSPESIADYKKEWNAIIDELYNFPSVIVYTPFNEAWGQFNTQEITEWTKKLDSTRLVNSASGGNFTTAGDVVDFHNYPNPAMPDPDVYGKERALVLGEFGGLGLPVKNHLWQDNKNWGYKTYDNKDEMLEAYRLLAEQLKPLITKGLSAAVYTQTTDVEQEINGFMTYDRKVMKMPVDELYKINQPLIQTTILLKK